MSARLRWGLFAAVFVGVLLAGLPLRLVLAATGMPAPLAASGASGTLWNGQLHGVHWDRTALGSVSLRLSPWHLALGEARLAAAGPRLAATVLQGRRTGVEHARGDLDLALSGLPLRLSLDNAAAVFDRDRCIAAGGALAIELAGPGSAGMPAPVLHARPRCDGGRWLAEFSAAPVDGMPAMHATLHLDRRGQLALLARVETADPALRLALASQGFETSGAGMSLRAEGRLWR
ncbi:exported type II protein secretion system protein N [Pseudoxanthomonas suwonensis 11-1]|uniref:Type II secretion system protein N n=1 Tax=Pseudoxanthomonas suwonensis (strain 11-1) TaxID=743721 RepID=E6WR44_PSEUU|nr:type II secretion system protein N [Pseudoxanthomonas suwonensis]ADV26789.1 exported type II protein secretion system protein N [Pseudoxanthomonas suwonensis 11-1]